MEAEEVRSATSAVRPVTLLATAPRLVVMEMVASLADVEAIAVVELAVKPATLVAVSDTCLATARRARNAITVSPCPKYPAFVRSQY